MRNMTHSTVALIKNFSSPTGSMHSAGPENTALSSVNNDEQPASISIPLPCAASDAVSLLPGEIPFSLENGRLSVTLPANGGAIFKLQEV